MLKRRKKKETSGTPAQFPPVGLKHRSGGFGIGLSIARGIAEAHRGSICARMVGEEVEFTAELR